MDSSPVTRIPTPGLLRPLRIAHLTDAHIGKIADDESHPLAKAMRDRMEYLRGQWGHDYESRLERLLHQAWDAHVDAIFLTGDAIDFPTGASVDYVRGLFDRSPCPVFYTPGNHDWNFTNQPGTNSLRTAQRSLLDSLHHGGVAVGCAGGDVGGLQVLTVDNSTYQVDAEQLAFVRERLERDLPTVLLIHIPITQPILRERTVAFWKQPILMGDEMDEAIRQQWNVETPTAETAALIDLLRAAPNLHGIFCGHVHFGHDESFSATATQYVGVPAFEGGMRFFDFQPA